MMAADPIAPNTPGTALLARLPHVRGTLTADAALTKLTWFRTGGPADVLFEPADEADLADFLAALPEDVPVTVLGLGSNALVRDGGIAGVVIRLGKPFASIAVDGDVLTVGGGAPGIAVAAAARDAGLTGFEYMRGVPGTAGGAVAMNAGAYGQETADILIDLTALDRQGRRHKINHGDIGFAYRQAPGVAGLIVTQARFRGTPADRETVRIRMEAIAAEREGSQPLRTRTGGSTFKNPPGEKAWALIDRAGCRGLRRGAAQVSEKHCNFLVNTGGATAADLEDLGDEVRDRVAAETGVELVWEIRRIGRRGHPADGGETS